jgi:hypothetical protein
VDVYETAQKGLLMDCLENIQIQLYRLRGELINEQDQGEVNRLYEVMYDRKLQQARL